LSALIGKYGMMGRQDVVAVLQNTPELVSDVLTISARMGGDTHMPYPPRCSNEGATSKAGKRQTSTLKSSTTQPHPQPKVAKKEKAVKPTPLYLVAMKGVQRPIGLKRARVIAARERSLDETVKAELPLATTAKTVVLIAEEGTSSAEIESIKTTVGDRMLVVAKPDQPPVTVPEGVHVIPYNGGDMMGVKKGVSQLVAEARGRKKNQMEAGQ